MLPNINPRQLQQAMKKMGVKQEEIEASVVIIKCGAKNMIVNNPQVMKVNMMGQESLQITGEIHEELAITDEDIATVAAQANVSKEIAKSAAATRRAV